MTSQNRCSRRFMAAAILGLVLWLQGAALAKGLTPDGAGADSAAGQGAGGSALHQVIKPEWYDPANSGIDLTINNPAEPFLRLGNWVIGAVGGIIILLGVWRLLVIGFKSMFGDKEFSDVPSILTALKPMGFGAIVVLLAVTGSWFSVLDMVWSVIDLATATLKDWTVRMRPHNTAGAPRADLFLTIFQAWG